MNNGYIYNPKWSEDVLQRSDSAKFLTKYLNSLYGDKSTDNIYSNSFVLCLNADWGFGKTFFIEHWSKDLKEELRHPVVYFDAWKNDFSDDPLIAFVSELERSLNDYKNDVPAGDKIIKNVVEMGKGAILPAIKTAANILVKKTLGTDIEGIAEIYEAASEGAINSYVDTAIESHNKRKDKINSFSSELESLLIKLKDTGKYELPMYIFIDELDRCKPSYAIQLLEAIKHIFGTKGVFFVVSTNKLQLSFSIKAIYGSEFDSISYLQRFFDQEYRLPKPDYEQFSEKLISITYRLEGLNIEKLKIPNFDLKRIFSTLSECFELPLRAQDQVAKQLKAIELSGAITFKIHVWYLLFLMMFRVKNEIMYYEYINNNDPRERVKILEKYFDVKKNISGLVQSNHDSYEVPGNVNIYNIIEEYIRLEKMDVKQLYKEDRGIGTLRSIKDSFRIEVPSSFPSGSVISLSIAKYKEALERAGNIS